MPQRELQIGEAKFVARRGQGRGSHALTGQQQSVGHLAQHDASDRRRQRKDRGPAQHAAERLGEFVVGYRLRRHDIDRTSDFGVRQAGDDGVDRVIERDPTHVLLAAAQFAAHSQAKRQQHFLERAAATAEDHAEARANDARRPPAQVRWRLPTGGKRRPESRCPGCWTRRATGRPDRRRCRWPTR